MDIPRRKPLLLVTGLALVLGATPAPADTLIVSNRGDGTVSFIDTDADEIVRTLKIDLGAHEFAVSPDGRTAVGSCYGSGPRHETPDQRLFVLDLAAPKLVGVIDLGPDHQRPNDLRFLGDGRVVVTSEVVGHLLTVDVEKGEIIRTSPFEQRAGHMLAVSPDGRTAYVPCIVPGGVVVLDLTGEQEKVWIDTGRGAEGVDLSPDGRRLWVANNRAQTISIIDTELRAVTRTIETEGYPFRVRFTPDGQRVVISHPGADEVRVYDADDASVQARVRLEGGQPTSLAVAASSHHAYVVCGPLGKVAEIDLGGAEDARVTAWYETGAGPDAIGISAVVPSPAPATPPVKEPDSSPVHPTGQ